MSKKDLPLVLGGNKLDSTSLRQIGYALDRETKKILLQPSESPLPVLVRPRAKTLLDTWKSTTCFVQSSRLRRRIEKSICHQAPCRSVVESVEVYRSWDLQQQHLFQKRLALRSQGGREFFKGFNIPDSAWFVTLDISAPTIKNRKGKDAGKVKDIYGARIDEYIDAIYTITRNGGWVLNITKSQPLPLLKQVIYIQESSSIQTEALDCSTFFLSCDSEYEPYALAHEVPIVKTNVVDLYEYPLRSYDRTIPKKFRNMVLNTPVPYRAVLESAWYSSKDPEDLDRANIEVVGNTSAEIEKAVEEEIHLIFSTNAPTRDEQELQDQYRSVLGLKGHDCLGCIGSYYLEANKDLL